MIAAQIIQQRADQVQEGDVICYADGNEVATIERITVARCDGAIGLHGNNDTWHSWYPAHNTFHVRRYAA